MAWMMSIRLDGQVSLLARWDKDGWVHLSVGMGAIWSDCRTKAGVIICHLVVGFTFIKGDGCPGVGIVACYLVVDFWSSRLMVVAPRLGTFGATWLWT